MIGRETLRGPVPKTLRPIFRDREEFTGGHTLTEATVAALDASAALIVLCSAAGSGSTAHTGGLCASSLSPTARLPIARC